MTDKEAKEYLEYAERSGFAQSGLIGVNWQEVARIAIKALNTNDALKKLIISHYTNSKDITVAIDNVSCVQCKRRIKNECPLTNDERCTQTAEEALNLYIEYIGENNE